MSIGNVVLDALRAVPQRIELSGHESSWSVSAASYDDALRYAVDRFGEVAVVARRDRGSRWPRVTLDITTDPARIAAAPAHAFRNPEPAPVPLPAPTPAPKRTTPAHVDRARKANGLVRIPTALVRSRPTRPAHTAGPERTPIPNVRAKADGMPASLEGFFSRQEAARHPDEVDGADLETAPSVLDAPGLAEPGEPAGPWNRANLVQLGFPESTLDAIEARPGAADLTWKARIRAVVDVEGDRVRESHPLGGVAVVGYGPAGAAAVVSAIVSGVEVGGLRSEAHARLQPVTANRVLSLLEAGLGQLYR